MSRFRLLHKLRKMPPHEIRTRLAEKLRVRSERKWYGNPAVVGIESAADLIGNCLKLVPGAKADQLQQLNVEFPEAHTQLAIAATARAEAVLAGQWEILGYPVNVDNTVDWMADPRTDFVFPRQFYADLSLYEIGNGVDVKYVWELGRHQFLVELARGWRFGGQQHYAVRARELLLDWIENNRQYEGVHWTSALELAMRGISWIWTIATLADWDGWQPGDFELITRSLREQAEFIEHHVSYYSSPYNHLVGEAAGLYIIGCALSGTPGAERWQQLGHRVLNEQGPRQFYDDGFCVEQATGYHYYTLGFMSLALVAARDQGEPIKSLEPVVHHAFRAGLAFRQPGGHWPAIGDVDSARAIPVHHDDFWEFDSLCVMGAVLFEDPQLLPPENTFSEEAYWLLGCDAQKITAADAKELPSTASVLPESGYTIAASGQDWICFDAGPLGDGLHADATPSTAHGHADALQILYRHQGRDILIDPGMPFYFGDDAWVGHFRSAAAHNTIDVDGIEMAKRAGRLAWSHVAPRPRLNARLADDAWLMRGLAEWGAGTIVERNILAIPGQGMWVADRIATDQPRSITWNWQMGEEQSLPQVWTNGLNMTTSEQPAAEESPVGWFAPGYGVHKQGRRICCQSPATNNALVVTFYGDNPLPLGVRVGDLTVSCPLDGAGTTGLTVGENDAEVVWRLEIDGRQMTYTAGGSTEGQTDLDGVGDWCVTKTVEQLSSVS